MSKGKKRGYTHIQTFKIEILEMIESGKTQREIAEHFGFKSIYVVKELLKRERKRTERPYRISKKVRQITWLYLKKN